MPVVVLVVVRRGKPGMPAGERQGHHRHDTPTGLRVLPQGATNPFAGPRVPQPHGVFFAIA